MRSAVGLLAPGPPRRISGENRAMAFKSRHFENFVRKLNVFRRIAMSADQTENSFAAMNTLCSAVITSRRLSTGREAACVTSACIDEP